MNWQKVVMSFVLMVMAGCQDSSNPYDNEPVYSPVGVVITSGDSVIVQYRGSQQITGEFTAKTGSYSPRYSFRLIDVSGTYFTPQGDSYQLTGRAEDNALAEVWIAGFDFFIKGKKPGRTHVILKVLVGASMLYTSQPIPTLITEY